MRRFDHECIDRVPDDTPVIALNLPPVKLSAAMNAYFKKCDEKLGFVPNVLKAFAFDDGKLKAFVDYRQQLVQELMSVAAPAGNVPLDQRRRKLWSSAGW